MTDNSERAKRVERVAQDEIRGLAPEFFIFARNVFKLKAASSVQETKSDEAQKSQPISINPEKRFEPTGDCIHAIFHLFGGTILELSLKAQKPELQICICNRAFVSCYRLVSMNVSLEF